MTYAHKAGLVQLILFWFGLISCKSLFTHWLLFVGMHLLARTGVIVSSILLIDLCYLYTIPRHFKNVTIFFDESILILWGQIFKI